MSISDDKAKKVRQAVKVYNDKLWVLNRRKGVSKGALPKKASAKAMLKAYANNEQALNKRLAEMARFTTKGKVYKTQGGVKLTDVVKRAKNKEIKSSYIDEKARYERSQRAGLAFQVQDYRKRKVERLSTNIEDIEYSKLTNLNYATSTSEAIGLQKITSVENFKKAIAYAISKDELNNQLDPRFEERLNRRLNALSPDEIADLMETNATVKSIMNLYREKRNKAIQLESQSYEELLFELDNDFPRVMRRYYRLRKQ